MTHAQKPDSVFRRNERVHLNRQRRQFSRLLAAEVCASAVVMLDTPRSEVVWRVLATHSIRQFPVHFPSRVSPCAITFQLDSISSELYSQESFRDICPSVFCSVGLGCRNPSARWSERLNCFGVTCYFGVIYMGLIHYKPAGPRFDSRWFHWNFSLT
jgi:hypothetical protein